MWSQQEVETGTANLSVVLPIGRTKQEVSWRGGLGNVVYRSLLQYNRADYRSMGLYLRVKR